MRGLREFLWIKQSASVNKTALINKFINTEYYAALTHFKNNISGLKYLCQHKLARFPHSFTILAATMLTKQAKRAKRGQKMIVYITQAAAHHIYTQKHTQQVTQTTNISRVATDTEGVQYRAHVESDECTDESHLFSEK